MADGMPQSVLAERLRSIREALASASEGRYPPPRLIAVTKTHPAETILPLRQLGQMEIGENRVQEIVQKLPLLREREEELGKFQIHLIGQLQTNKVKYIIKDVCLIQSMDRLSLAREIDRRAQACQRVMPVLVQVSPAGEPQKGGIAPEELRAFLREAAAMPGLRVRGLMAVMPDAAGTEKGRVWLDTLFSRMRTLFEQIREEGIPGVDMEELSMGMSGDYLLAARHGATMVRVGSAIFGPRAYPTGDQKGVDI